MRAYTHARTPAARCEVREPPAWVVPTWGDGHVRKHIDQLLAPSDACSSHSSATPGPPLR
jgi:hypothetical protein